MFGKHRWFAKVAGAVLTVAVLVPVAQAGAQQPRAMPSDYVANLGQLPRAMPADYGSLIKLGEYGLARPTRTDYAGHVEPLPRALPAEYSTLIKPGGGSSGEGGFDWADAGIGAAAAFGLVLVAAAGRVAARRRGLLARA